MELVPSSCSFRVFRWDFASAEAIPPVPIKFSQKRKDKYVKTQNFLYPRIPFQAKFFPHLVRGAFAPTQIVPNPDAPIERAGFSVQMRTAASGVCP